MGNNWINIIQDYLLPPTCILCGNSGHNSQDICPACLSDLKRNIHCCYRCAETFEVAPPTPQLCGRCLKKSPAFDETYAPFIHESSIRYLIATLKFNKQYKNARLLGYLLATYIEKTTEIPELIIPVPLHKKRHQERGFNQSIEIAKTAGKILNIPVDAHLCTRIRDTPHQIELPAKQRRKNVKNAFVVTNPTDLQHVAILDDVITTGSTTNEVAKALKKAGIVKVDVWGCAKA
jgi:ComF family protein